MNRRELEEHLRNHMCDLLRHGKKHDIWQNTKDGALSAIPRHRVIKKGTVRSICRALGVPLPANV